MRGVWLILAAVLFSGLSQCEAAVSFFDPDDLDSVGPELANGRVTSAPSVRACALNGETIVLDGVLDDTIWGRAEGATGFSKWDPARGEQAQEETIFKIVYDDDAFYVGIACLVSDPAGITERLCRRDHIHDSDVVSLYLDTYNDNTTGFNFRVNSLGVKGDRYVYNDGNMDRDWDAVWEAETSRDEHGWYVEMRIPFSSVRYRRSDEMTWGCNLYRWMHVYGQDSCWTVWDTETRGFVSRFGSITGLTGVPHSRQLEVMPYAVARVTDPSATGEDEELDHYENFGLDLKYGLTSNFTLTAAAQPDFGQVEADPSLLNLSPFETYYDEKRPFFVEGNRYFEHPRFNVFYSRRIGTGDENARIRFAGKLTGKTAQDISVAALYAVTDVTEEGQAHNFLKSGENSSQFLVGRFGKEFAGGAHRVNVMQTAAFRSAERQTYDEDDYPSRDAWTTAMDFDLNFHDRDYNVAGAFLGTVVDPAPVASDPSIGHGREYGTAGNLGIRKLGGTFRGGLSGSWETDELDPNDMGFLRAADEVSASGWVRYQHNSTREDAMFLRGDVGIELWNSWLYAAREGLDRETDEVIWSYGRGYPHGFGMNLNGSGQLSNFWHVWSGVGWEPQGSTKYATRTYDGVRGPLMKYPANVFGWLGFNTDYRKPLTANLDLNAGGNERGAWNRRVSVGLDWTATETMTYSLHVSYRRSHSEAQHLENFANPGGGIGGVSYVFAELEQQTVDATLRSDILFGRDLSLQLYAQPYLTVGGYGNARELATPNSYDLVPAVDVPNFDYGAVADYDFSYSAMNINAVLRWEYRPGSTLYVVWKQGRDLYDDRFENPDLETSIDFDGLLDTEPENVLLAKITYWFSI